MIILDPGHMFGLAQLDGDEMETLRFVKRIGCKFPGNIPPGYAGTNLQEVFRACISRVQYLDAQISDYRNSVVLHHLRQALHALELRAAERHHITLPVLDGPIELIPVCPHCGHIACVHAMETRERTER